MTKKFYEAPISRITHYVDTGSVSLLVDCPNCPEEHRHGGGTSLENLILGTRGSHCAKDERVHYELVVDRFTVVVEELWWD